MGYGALSLFATTVAGSPWITSGDARFRYALESMGTPSVNPVRTSTSTWPILWRDVLPVLQETEVSDISARAYLLFEWNRVEASAFTGESLLSLRREASRWNGFQSPSRYARQAGHQQHWVHPAGWAAGLAVQQVEDQGRDKTLLDGSYLAAVWRDGVAGIGAIDRWWGPGRQSSVLLSHQGRPLPGFWVEYSLDRGIPTQQTEAMNPFPVRVLLLNGSLDRYDGFSDNRLSALRLSFQPVPQFEGSLSRLTSWDSREDAPEQILEYWFLDRKSRLRPELDWLGIDARWSLGDWTKVPVHLYGQGRFDQASGSAGNHALWGMDWIQRSGYSSRQWFVEWLDGGEFPVAGSTGSSGRDFATGQIPGTQMVTLGAIDFLDNGQLFGASLSWVRFPAPAERNREDSVQLSVRHERTLGRGWLVLDASFLDSPQEFLDDSQYSLDVGATWRFRF